MVEYQLWYDDPILGRHLSIFNRWYYTKIGARLDTYHLKKESEGGTAKLFEAAGPWG